MVDILTAVLTDGLPAVEAACAELAKAVKQFTVGTLAARKTMEDLIKAFPQSEAAQAAKERLAKLR